MTITIAENRSDLRSSDQAVVLRALSALSKHNANPDPKLAFEVLTLLFHSDAVVRAAAVSVAGGQWIAHAAHDIILDMLVRTERDQSVLCALVLSLAAHLRLGTGHIDTASDIYRRIVADTERDPKLRKTAQIELLALQGRIDNASRGYAQTLLAMDSSYLEFSEDKPTFRNQPAREIIDLDNEKLDPSIGLSSASGLSISQALSNLGRVKAEGAEAYVPKVLELLSHSDAAVREDAVVLCGMHWRLPKSYLRLVDMFGGEERDTNVLRALSSAIAATIDDGLGNYKYASGLYTTIILDERHDPRLRAMAQFDLGKLIRKISSPNYAYFTGLNTIMAVQFDMAWLHDIATSR